MDDPYGCYRSGFRSRIFLLESKSTEPLRTTSLGEPSIENHDIFDNKPNLAN